MKHYLQLSAVALCLATTTGVKAQSVGPAISSSSKDVSHKQIGTYTIGSMLGGVDTKQITKKEINYYDSNNHLAYTAKYGADLTGEGDFTLTNLVKYTTIERNDSLIQNASYYQWGMYNFGDPGFKKQANPSGVISQVYNKKGQLLRDEQASYTYEYEYADNGQLSKKTKINTYNGTVSEISTYTYDDGGRIQAETVTNATGAFKLKYVYEYDEADNKVLAQQWKRTSVSDENTEYLAQYEKWEYTDGQLVQYTKYTGGKAALTEGGTATEPAPSSRKTYETYQGNKNQILITSYTYNKADGTWIQGGLPVIEEYADFYNDVNIVAQLYDTKLSVKRVEGSYKTSVSFAAPRIAWSNPSKITLFRDGQVVKTLTIGGGSVPQELNTATGEITLVDSLVLAGRHDYFIQTSVGHGDELATLDELTWTPANISATASVDVDYDFKPVSNLRLLEAKKDVKKNGDGTTAVTRTATVAYDNPAVDESSQFVKNELYRCINSHGLVSYALYDETHDIDKTTLSCPFLNDQDSINVVVVSHYKVATVVSEPLTIRKADFDKLATSISVPLQDDVLSVRATDDAISVSGKADIRILTLDGRQVVEAKDSGTVSTSHLHGAYLIAVEKDGKLVKTLKYMKK